MIESFKFEKTSQDHQVHVSTTMFTTKPHLSATSVSLYKTFKNSDYTAFLGSLMQYLTTLLVKKVFLVSNLKLSWCNLKPFSLVLVLVISSTLSLLSAKLNIPSSLNCFSSDLHFRPFSSSIALLWTLFSTSMSFWN